MPSKTFCVVNDSMLSTSRSRTVIFVGTQNVLVTELHKYRAAGATGDILQLILVIT